MFVFLVCFSCQIADGQNFFKLAMSDFNRENLFDLAKKITSPTNLDKWKDAVKSVLYEEAKQRFFLPSNVVKASFLSLPEVASFVTYFSEASHQFWAESKSDKKKMVKKHGPFFSELVSFPSLESLAALPIQGGGDAQDDRSTASMYRDADKIVANFSGEAIFKAAHKKLKELGFVDAAFVWSELIKEPVDLGKKFRRAKTIDFDNLKPKIPRLSAGELILNNGLTVSTYKVPIST